MNFYSQAVRWENSISNPQRFLPRESTTTFYFVGFPRSAFGLTAGTTPHKNVGKKAASAVFDGSGGEPRLAALGADVGNELRCSCCLFRRSL
jgi:hypothetical protein